MRNRFQQIISALLLSIVLTGNSFGEDRGKQYFDTLENIKKCAVGKTGSEVAACYVNGTPKKCQQQALNLFPMRDDGASTSWFICIASCADAGVWSSTFGECSR